MTHEKGIFEAIKNGGLGTVLTALIACATIFGWFIMSKNYEVFQTKADAVMCEKRIDGDMDELNTRVDKRLATIEQDIKAILRVLR